MPAFSPVAGPSPNCCAVLVQMEHCANRALLNAIKKMNINATHFFIRQPVSAKLGKDKIKLLLSSTNAQIACDLPR